MIVKWKIGTGYPGAGHEGEWEVDDDITDSDLDEMMQEELNDNIEYWWERPKKDESKT